METGYKMRFITPESLEEKKELKKALAIVLNEAEISALGDKNKKVLDSVDLVNKKVLNHL
tara:strand:+ start:53 stop:232 length:180 start_codon:yes stop_codon:yes gene_type:complete